MDLLGGLLGLLYAPSVIARILRRTVLLYGTQRCFVIKTSLI
jgi:hypothetical protein